MKRNLPEPVAAYWGAEEAKDAEKLGAKIASLEIQA
jgi:hypothetical protein